MPPPACWARRPITTPTPWFWSDQYDVKLQIAGLNRGYDGTVLRPGKRPSSQSIWYFRGERSHRHRRHERRAGLSP